MREPLFTSDILLDPAAVEAQVSRDVALLELAGRQWRWLGWLWFFGGMVLSLPLIIRVVFVGMNRQNLEPTIWAAVRVLIVLAFFIGIANLYFFIAGRLARGQRWAASVALFLAAVAATITGMRILYRIVHRQHDIPGMIIESALLVTHLNLLRLLFRSHAAARRVRLLAALRLEAAEVRGANSQQTS